MKRFSILILLFAITPLLFAQKESGDVRRGNSAYNKEKYVDAEVDYRKGLEKNSKSFSGSFNLGNALYRQEKYTEAAEQFQIAVSLAGTDKARIAEAYHNMGNSLLQTGDFAKSIEAYKQALRNNPKDNDTRYNLVYAQHMLKEQQNQNQNQQQEQQQQQQEQQDKNNQEKQEEQQQQKQEQQSTMSKERAEEILKALEQDERETQKKVKEAQAQQAKRHRVDKDW
ncbi:MAG TPA: tetratricopeptide repeat protein [Paludibacteraceae bacterium]|nr:tetratricopeptide repeat protein [Paludibacteraceae bacterium]HQB68544.1 tetratricopeptide repeat protein [Paludibacteraceae bacterium]HRS67045.1 tetratricopeptide repeat protein [Paludibacteraceae bacterium]